MHHLLHLFVILLFLSISRDYFISNKDNLINIPDATTELTIHLMFFNIMH